MKRDFCWINCFVVAGGILSFFRAVLKLPWDKRVTRTATLPVHCRLLDIGCGSGLRHVKDCVCIPGTCGGVVEQSCAGCCRKTVSACEAGVNTIYFFVMKLFRFSDFLSDAEHFEH